MGLIFLIVLVVCFSCNVIGENWSPNRIITDLKIIYGSHGVPVDFWYNETNRDNPEELSSVPGCPQSIDGFPWVHYGTPPRCFLTGQNGPCPENQVMFPQQDSVSGFCACSCLIQGVEKRECASHGLKSNKRFEFCHSSDETTHIWDKKEKVCHNLFEQGLCPHGTAITGYNDTSLYCNPLCRDENRDRSKPCEIISECLAASNYLRASGEDCNGDKTLRYSRILKTCVPRFVKDVLFRGIG